VATADTTVSLTAHHEPRSIGVPGAIAASA
jgi:hypothetical protein